MIENSGFESGLANWGVFNGTVNITLDAFAGSSAVSLESNRAGIDQGFNVLAGETYTLSGYGKTTDVAWSGLGITFYNNEWTVLDKTSTRISGEEWTEYTFDALAPEGATRGIVWAWKGGVRCQWKIPKKRRQTLIPIWKPQKPQTEFLWQLNTGQVGHAVDISL